MHRLLLAALALALLGTPAAADWASFHHDARNTGFVAGSSYPVYKDVWWSNRTAGNAQIHASPVLKDGILVTADMATAGLVRALDAESGHEIWSYKMTAPVEGTPAIAGERVYVVDRAGNLVALGLKTGTLESTAATPVGATYSSIREHEGKLFIGNEAGEMRAYLSSTLTLLWNFPTSSVYDSRATSPGQNQPAVCGGTNSAPLSAQPIRGAAAVFDRKVYFGSLNHYLFAVDEEGQGNGKTTVMWIAKTNDVVIGAPVVVLGGLSGGQAGVNRIAVGSYDGHVYAFDPSPGGQGGDKCLGYLSTPQWTYEVPSGIDSGSGTVQVSKVQSSVASSGDKVFFGANNGHVYALRSDTGQLVWERTAGSDLAPVTSSPAVANGIVVVGSEDKNVYWLSAANGSVLRSFTTKSAVATSPAIDGDRAFIAAQDGTLYMFGPTIPPRADLVVASITATTAGVTVTVRNAGAAAAAASAVRIELGGAFLGRANLPAINASGEATATLAAAVPATAVSLKAEVDPDNAVKEANESNNSLTQAVNLTPPPPPPTTTTKPTSKKAGAAVWLGVLALVAAGRRRR